MVRSRNEPLPNGVHKSKEAKHAQLPSETTSISRKSRRSKSNLLCSKKLIKRLTYAVGMKKTTKGSIELIDKMIQDCVVKCVRRSVAAMDKKNKKLTVEHLKLASDERLIGFA